MNTLQILLINMLHIKRYEASSLNGSKLLTEVFCPQKVKSQPAKPQNNTHPLLMYPGNQRMSQTCQGTFLNIHKMLDWILATTQHGFRVILTCGQSPHECPNCLATEITSIAKPGSKCFLFTSKSKINVIHATLCKYNCKDSSSKNRSGRKVRTSNEWYYCYFCPNKNE